MGCTERMSGFRRMRSFTTSRGRSANRTLLSRAHNADGEGPSAGLEITRGTRCLSQPPQSGAKRPCGPWPQGRAASAPPRSSRPRGCSHCSAAAAVLRPVSLRAPAGPPARTGRRAMSHPVSRA
eukprot:scaffold92265_cov32-Tisochrysis_lutea.AAC.3